jgi:nicotinate-nucleotide--dimethylbenzimidazole phosphoribosyltransferase
LEILREVGGAELAAIAGGVAEARRRSIPVLLDGYVVAAAVAPLERAVPGALDHCLAGHQSAEPGHIRLLERLGKIPLLRLDLRLGEGTGALAALPLVKLAAACVTDVATFEEWGLA